MYNDDESIWGTIFGTLFLGGMFYLNRLAGKEDALREIEEKKQKEEIENLKKRFEELKAKGY